MLLGKPWSTLQIRLQLGTGAHWHRGTGDRSGRMRGWGSGWPQSRSAPLALTRGQQASGRVPWGSHGHVFQQQPGQGAPAWQCQLPSQFQPVPSRSHGNL